MSKIKKYLIQEGEVIPRDIEEIFHDYFEFEDIKLREKSFISQFTGFIIANEKMLVSFPKHFYNIRQLNLKREEIELFIDDDIRLLFNTIRKVSVKKSERGIGISKDINKSYPFEDFYGVYNYFQKYGLYSNELKKNVPGYNGKVDWKKTFEKSPLLLNNGNLLYMPMEVSKKYLTNTFISKCMAYVIDSTVEKFNVFIHLDKTNFDTKDINWDNKEKVINQLKELKNKIFKDIDKRLVHHLINFFENENSGNNLIQIKLHTFNLVWEDMMEKYLNNYFIGVEENTVQKKLIFSEVVLKESKNFKKEKFNPDVREEKGHTLEPDHFQIEGNNRYIFDSKYYQKIFGLDYKQVSYHYLLKHIDNKLERIKTHNALLLPTDREKEDPRNFKNHFILKSNGKEDNSDFLILEQYINIRDVMKKY